MRARLPNRLAYLGVQVHDGLRVVAAQDHPPGQRLPHAARRDDFGVHHAKLRGGFELGRAFQAQPVVGVLILMGGGSLKVGALSSRDRLGRAAGKGWGGGGGI
jgi:hypothetical protein